MDHVGVIGHSFGAVTAGWVAERDERVEAALVLAAPVENPLIAGVTAAEITVPTVMLLAIEDNSIGALGNTFLNNNFNDIAGPAIKLDMADAGHWSVSDLCGLVDAFGPGCGEDTRQTDGSMFSYVSADVGRSITASWAVALFRAVLHNDPGAAAWLNTTPGDDQVEIARRNGSIQ